MSAVIDPPSPGEEGERRAAHVTTPLRRWLRWENKAPPTRGLIGPASVSC